MREKIFFSSSGSVNEQLSKAQSRFTCGRGNKLFKLYFILFYFSFAFWSIVCLILRLTRFTYWHICCLILPTSCNDDNTQILIHLYTKISYTYTYSRASDSQKFCCKMWSFIMNVGGDLGTDWQKKRDRDELFQYTH